MLTSRLLRHRSRRRWIARHAAVRPTALNAHATSAWATLNLVAPGLIGAVDGRDRPWRWLIETLLLALLALGLFVAAQHSCDKRFGWLLSGSVAAGLAIAASYNLIDATVTPAIPAAGVMIILIAIILFFMRGAARHPPRR